jgi:tight adherence protein C
MAIEITSFIGAVSLVLLGLSVILFSVRLIRGDDVSKRIKEYVIEDYDFTPQVVEATTVHLRGNLWERTVMVWFVRVAKYFGRFTPKQTMEETNRKLAVAGYPFNIRAREFYGIRILSFIFGLILVAILHLRVDYERFYYFYSFIIVFYLMPVVWLRMQVRNRQKEILKGLPDALDMLSVCVAAGLGFDQAVQRVSQHWQTPIGVEFGRVISEMEVGIPRRDALRSLASRLEIPELSSFVSVIIQSEQMGMSIADTLRIQADQMRIQRRYRAREAAQQLPAKMVVPLAFLILPALIAVILGPSISTIMEVF